MVCDVCPNNVDSYTSNIKVYTSSAKMCTKTAPSAFIVPKFISRSTEVKLVPCPRLHLHSDPSTQIKSETTFNVQDHSKPCFTVVL